MKIQLPEAYKESVKALLGEEYDAYLESFQHPFKRGLRVNTLKWTPQECVSRMSRNGICHSLTPIPWISNGFFYEEGAKLSKDPYYYAGLYYLQEPSAMMPASVLPVQPGDKVSVSINTVAEGAYSVNIYNYSRDGWIWAFLLIFALVLLLVGGRQGVKALLSLGLTVFCVIFLLVPLLVQRGWPPIPTTLAIISYTIFVTFVILGGIQVKTMVAAAGSLGGVLLAGGLAWAACQIVHISGMNMDEAEALMLTAVDNGLKIRGLYICGILIAAEGAVMDIAMSISSAVSELHEVNPALTARQLFKSGMNIGRDAMGTMANTLVLAFAGTSLNMMIFIYAYDISYIQLLNTDFVAIEIIRSISGSIGIVLTVPLVAAISAHLLARQHRKAGAAGRLDKGPRPEYTDKKL